MSRGKSWGHQEGCGLGRPLDFSVVRHQIGNALPGSHLCLLPGHTMDSELVFMSLLDPGDQSQKWAPLSVL